MSFRAVLLLSLLASPLPRVTSAQAASSDSAAVSRVHERVFTALRMKDTVAFSTLTSPEVTFRFANGQAVTRDELFALLRGPITLDSIPQLGWHVRVYGSAAVVTGRARNYFRRPDRSGVEHLMYTLTYVRSNGVWRLVAYHSTLEAQPTP